MRIAAVASISVLWIAWSLFTFRLAGLPFLAVFLYAGLSRPAWATRPILLALVLASFASAWFPIGVTRVAAAGPPHLVECCCCAPYPGGALAEATRAQSAGQCAVCSDLVTGFEPHWYLVW